MVFGVTISSIRLEYVENKGGQERIYAYATVLLSLLCSGHPLQVDHLGEFERRQLLRFKYTLS